MKVHNFEQGSEEWRLARSGIPTASEFKNLVTSNCKESEGIGEYAIILAAEKFAGKNIDSFTGNRATERGKELESEAISDYEMTNQVIVKSVGFITNNLKTYGCSPDGLVYEDGSMEVKCKIAKEHVKVLLEYDKTGQIPSEYFAQPQGVMFVAKRKWCDLVFYHPELPGLIVRQYPDANFVKVLKRQLKAVIAKRNVILETLNKI